MRISEDRYDRERRSLELALRFLRHEARTQTIRTWTALSDDRIRKLYRSYLSRAACRLPRHRGKSPQQIAFFARSLKIQQETALLASLYCLEDLLPRQPSVEAAAALPGLARGLALCAAFEMYRAMVPSAAISFEHAVFLALALARGDQLQLGACADCGGLVVAERFPLREQHCHHCALPSHER
jgi:hypothetical protein